MYIAATVGTVQSSCGHCIKEISDVTLEQLGRSLPEGKCNKKSQILTSDSNDKHKL